MKKVLLLSLLLIGNFFLFGQDFLLKVKLYPNDKLKNKNYSINSEEKLSKVIQKFKSNGLVACYPNAKTQELILYYTIKGKGDKQTAMQELMSLNLFETIAEEDTFQIALCTNPTLPVNDTWIAQGWANNRAMELIEANCAWTISKGNPNIHIGIADSEFEDTHDDLKNQITNLDGQSSANNPHGTYVSGLAAPETNNNTGISGIGYYSKIAAHRIPHTSGGTASALYIRNAIWNLYQDGRRIINVSWTGTGLDIAAAQEITQNGTVLVLAAGNTNTPPFDTSHSYIANIPGVIIVSGVDQNNEHGPTNHTHNQWVDVCAPSTNVTTTYPNNTYGGVWGTSGAAPQVAGTIALMLAVNPCLTPSEIELLIEQSADSIADASSFVGLIGSGKLNAYKALIETIESGRVTNTSTTFSGTQTITAPTILSANGKVTTGSDITFQAPREVELRQGFEVEIGAELEIVMVNTCPFE